MPADLPHLDGVLTAAEVARTARSICQVQEPSGAIPWSRGQKTDVWNHVEAAMALVAAGRRAPAERAYEWVTTVQRDDGSVPLEIVEGEVTDTSGETNMSSYLAVGVWHHWLVCRDPGFVRRMWPVVRRGLDYAVRLQLPWGGVAWSQEWRGGRPAGVNQQALVAASASVHHALWAGVALAELMDDPQPEWELAGGRLGHALREHREEFLDKSGFSMDWYYPVLGGALRGAAGLAHIDERWDTFVEPGLGVRCVSANPWVTGAETCELALALDAVGDRDRALGLLRDMQHLRHEDGGYWTGLVLPERVNWPGEHTSYTAAAVILAVDALSGSTPGSTIMRGTTFGPWFGELALECGCGSPDRVAGRP